MTSLLPETREAWLYAVTDAVFRPWFAELGYTIPERIRFGVGWPSKGSRSTTVAECYAKHASPDGHHEIIVGTNFNDSIFVLAAVAHELAHASLEWGEGHGRTFARLVKDLGLEGRPTATVPGEIFTDLCRPILARFGPYPHAALGQRGGGTHGKPLPPSSGPKQSTRMVKCRCLNIDCPSIPEQGTEGYIVRTTRKWLDEFGAPACPACDEILVEEHSHG